MFYFVCARASAESSLSLNASERLLYTNILLETDGDYLLTVAELIMKRPGASFSWLQQNFPGALLERLRQKIRSPYIKEPERTNLLGHIKRVETWKRGTRYTEHLLYPRLSWLLDLGFLVPEDFDRHRYFLTGGGTEFLNGLPVSGEYLDVSTDWLYDGFWYLMPRLMLGISLSDWEQMGGDFSALCAHLLEEAFRWDFRPRKHRDRFVVGTVCFMDR